MQLIPFNLVNFNDIIGINNSTTNVGLYNSSKIKLLGLLIYIGILLKYFSKFASSITIYFE